MKVKIDSPMGTKTYDMEESDVLRLLHDAWKLSHGNFEEDPPPSAPPTEKELENTSPPAPVKKAEPVSRAERMFGKRETWGQQARSAEQRPVKQEEPEGWKGFMVFRCPECGSARSFYTRDKIFAARCLSCGCETPLENLIPAYVECGKCGKTLKYRTNIRDDYPVTLNCIECNAPIDMQLNRRGTALVTINNL